MLEHNKNIGPPFAISKPKETLDHDRPQTRKHAPGGAEPKAKVPDKQGSFDLGELGA
jgi:hypothetical protein